MSRAQLDELLRRWIGHWNRHDLDQVMAVFADDAEFVSWNGRKVEGRGMIHYAWRPWFAEHGDFEFTILDLLIDEAAQSAAMTWQLDWPSREPGHQGQRERRFGVDWLTFVEGRLLRKHSYCQLVVQVGGESIVATS
jgi:ketosteroid isomerase-like protein